MPRSAQSISTSSPPARHPPSCRVAVLAVEGALASSMTAPLDAFRLANTLFTRVHPGEPEPFLLDLVHAHGKREVMTAGGLLLSGIKPLAFDTEILLVPGLAYRGAQELDEKIEQLTSERALLQRAHAEGLRIGGGCSGSYLMAASGILDGKKAATSWWLAPAFAQRFPKVELDPTAVYVESGNLATAGAVTAMFTVVLRLIEARMGQELALNTARVLLVDYERQSQAPFVTEALLQRPRTAFSEKIENYLRARLAQPLSVEALAAHSNMSPRTLLRRFQQVYHRTPQAYMQQLRITRAKALLETTQLSLPEVIEQCGYSDLASFRKLFKRLTDLTPADYRMRFSLRGP